MSVDKLYINQSNHAFNVNGKKGEKQYEPYTNNYIDQIFIPFFSRKL